MSIRTNQKEKEKEKERERERERGGGRAREGEIKGHDAKGNYACKRFQLFVVRVGHCFPTACLCLSLYNMHVVINVDASLLVTKAATS